MWNMDEIENYSQRIRDTMALSSEHVLSPVATFQSQSEIWIVYPLFVGGPLSELLASHYVNGMTDEDVVATILYDVAEGLHAIHCADLVHSNIRPRNLHMVCCIDSTYLTVYISLCIFHSVYCTVQVIGDHVAEQLAVVEITERAKASGTLSVPQHLLNGVPLEH